MPYKSKAQQAKFHVLEKQGKISKKTVDEFDRASKGKRLPEKLGIGAAPRATQPRDMSRLNDEYDKKKKKK